ncbi:hypothetical protein KP509_15G018700 [Ceratopteris richardii]|uniref:Uncharacterized protein n=1 Tax=Ceratopteris richardii TaxID=49495 RepID=A0A8T2T1G6_CERRI|nr:hypothetical protein KP509_15G018700 [Ceratopteris richardii]
MSAALVRDFFPGLENFLGHTLWNVFFPSSVERLCPRPHVSVQVTDTMTITLMWPAASIWCALGVIIGFSYGTLLLCKGSAWKTNNGTFIWVCAFLWYGTMSLGGLLYHCISKMRVFYLLDVISTACTCATLIAIYRIFLISNYQGIKLKSSLFLTYIIISCLAIYGGDRVMNILYLGPASLAFILGSHFALEKGSQSTQGRLALIGASLSAVTAIAAVPLDAWFCYHFGSNFSMLFWFFAGSDLAMVFLFHYTQAIIPEKNSTGHLFKGKCL